MPNINAILRKNPVNCRYGAPMGRRNQFSEADGKLYLQRVKFVDGDYSPDGTYWGIGYGVLPLWCAFHPDGETMIFVRAANREAAITAARDNYPSAEFIRN